MNHPIAAMDNSRVSVQLGMMAILFVGIFPCNPLCGQQADSASELSQATQVLDFKTENGNVESVGEVVLNFSDGSVLFLTPDGQLRTIRSKDILSREASSTPMVPLTQDQIFNEIKGTLPAGFSVLKKKHYVIVFNTSEAYADWVGALFERLYRGFYNYWDRHHDVQLDDPRFPLVALVFRDKESYLRYATDDIGDVAKSMIGYYNMQSNRIVTFDLTGVNGLAPRGMTLSNTRLINQILSRPQAERTVATIVHEAVHQIAYNSGLQVRLADNPRWLSEGLAMYFESPDFGSSTGWSMGKVNYYNLRRFAQFVPRRKADSLTTLIANDDRLLNTQQAANAYPESWALTYFLMKAYKKEFVNYMQALSELPPMGTTDDRAKVEMFQSHFGDDIQGLNREFMRFMQRVR